MKIIILFLFYLYRLLALDYIIKHLNSLYINFTIKLLSKKFNCKINFVKQGQGSLTIECHKKFFKDCFFIHPTSHLKSNTYIECSGSVKIDKYFHTGRSLTILTTNHDYRSMEYIPYGLEDIEKPVIIEGFVWCGLNVTILPGVHIGEGAIIAACSVVTKNVPAFAVVAGNPAKVINYRNVELFNKLKNEKKYL